MSVGSALGLLLLLLLGTAPPAAAQAKRVLIVHSFGSTAPPFTTHSTAFETTLTQEMGKRVDLDEVSLDMARYAQPDMEEPFVELMLKRLAKWQPDLVVPVGSPAGRFVAKYRQRLFPDIPVIYTGIDSARCRPPRSPTTPPSWARISGWPGSSRTSCTFSPRRSTSRSCSEPRRSSATGPSSSSGRSRPS